MNRRNPKSKFTKFLTGKGFYMVLAACLVGTGAAAWVAVQQTTDRLTSPSNPDQVPSQVEQVQSEPERGVSRLEEAGKQVEGVPTEPPPSSSSASNSSSSSSQSSAQQNPSSEQSTTSAQQTEQEQSQELQFMLPTSGDVLNSFSNGKLVKSTTLGDWRTHNGVDLAVESGTPVKCVADGTVTKVESDGLWGTVIEVTHEDGLVSIYKGLSEALSVSEGQEVEIGQVVGAVAPSFQAEVAEGPHLHFELMQNGEYVDPLTTMDKVE